MTTDQFYKLKYTRNSIKIVNDLDVSDEKTNNLYEESGTSLGNYHYYFIKCVWTIFLFLVLNKDIKALHFH